MIRQFERRPACGDRCGVVVTLPLMGGSGSSRERVEIHDPDAHEAYVRAQYEPSVVRTGPLVIDLRAASVRIGDEPVRLGRAQYRVLECLTRRAGSVVPHQELLAAIDPALVGASGKSYLTSTITVLRRKLKSAGHAVIQNRVELGYVFTAEPTHRRSNGERP